MSTAKVEVISKNHAQTIGEGPHWDEKTGKLLFVDIDAGNVHRLDLSTMEDECFHLRE